MSSRLSGTINPIEKISFVLRLKQLPEVYVLLILALSSRFLVLPFTQAIESDATTRIFIAEHALNNQGELRSFQWPSLQIYFLSAAQFISQQRVLGPVILSLLMGAFSVVPFYRFTKNIFSEKGAFYASLIFTFSPLIFRLSFVPLSEIYHVFFCVSALYFLSEGLVRQTKKIKWGVLAGIAITIACGGRFEAWALAGLLGVILLVLREWKMALSFGTIAAIYPIAWMIYCYKGTGNPLVSLQIVEHFNFDIMKMNENLDAVEKYRRLIFFPFSWWVSISPAIGAISLWILFKKILKKNCTLIQLLFSFLFFFFLLFFIYEAKGGSLATQHRYSVTLLMLSIPFFSLWFEHGNRLHKKKIISVLLTVIMIPWAYSWRYLPLYKLFLTYEKGEKAIAHIVANTAWEGFPVPRFEYPVVNTMTKKIKKYSFSGDGFFLDWVNWCESYYFLQQCNLPFKNMMLADPSGPYNGSNGSMQRFFMQNPKGIILLKDFSNLYDEENLTGPILEIKNCNVSLLLLPLYSEKHLRLFRYKTFTGAEAVKIKKNSIVLKPLYTCVKDIDHYMTANLNDPSWLATTWKDAVRGHITIETQVRRNAEWLIEHDKPNLERISADSTKK